MSQFITKYERLYHFSDRKSLSPLVVGITRDNMDPKKFVKSIPESIMMMWSTDLAYDFNKYLPVFIQMTNMIGDCNNSRMIHRPRMYVHEKIN